MSLKSLKSLFTSVAMLLLSLVVSLPVSSQEKKYQGLLWEISGNGLKKPSYIYGTMHVSNKLAFHLSDTFFIAIKNCDMVALEINPDTWFEELVKSDLIAGFMQEQNSYSYGRNFYGDAFALKSPENSTIGELLATNHMLTNYMLYRFGSASDNFEENTYLDLFIYQTGKKQNKKVSSLENAETMLEMTGKASLPDDDDDDNSYYTNSDWYDKVRASGKSPQELLENAYRLGDLDMLDSLGNMMNNSKNYQKYMIVERNKQMAYRLDSLMKINSVFAGAGAAHLPGNEGIITLLREKGYHVRPVGKISSKKTDQLMKKSETTFYPLTYKKQFVGDSLFSCGFPGDILETPGFEQNKDYFFPEMINGAHYNITRINTYSPITGLSQDYMMKRLDSLFYENIPGKILKKKIINLQGIPGYDIINKTRRGDIQRYNIFVTPMEIIIVKIGGTGDFVKKEGDKFFSTFSFNHKSTNGWKLLNSRKGGFAVEMPVDMLVSSDHLDHSSTNEIFQSMDFSDSSYYTVMKGSLHDFYYIEEDSFELNYITKQFFKELKYNKLRDSLISFLNFPALDATATSDSSRFLHTRLIIKGPDYYLLVNQNFSENPNKKFFNSFRLNGYKYDEPFVEHIDTNLFFKVNTIEPPKKSSLFGYANNYGRRKKKGEDWSFLPENKYESHYCPQTRESINVKYYRFHKYEYYNNFDSLVNEILERSKKDKDFIVKKVSTGLIDSLPYLEMLQLDTNSTRAIRSKIIIKHGASWTITACIDTLSEPSEYITKFFETFRPIDSLIGNSIFVDKSAMFFEDLKSEDSLRRAHALKSIYAIDFKKDDKKKLMDIINSNEFKTFSLTERSSFILKFGEIAEEDDAKVFKNLYMAAEDTATIQLAVLQALADQKKLASTKTFSELLISNPPFTDSEYDMMPMFLVYNDSLELARLLFPGIMNLTRYDEYSSTIYDLLARMVDSAVFTKKDLNPYLPELLRESSIELKRQAANLENKIDKNYYYKNDIEISGYNIPNPGNNYFNHSDLANFISILAPFKNDKPVSDFYNKIFASGDDYIKIYLTEKYIENDWKLNDTVIPYFAKSDMYRWEIYSILKENKKLNLVPDSLFNQENIARSLIFSQNDSEESDTIVFITKKLVSTKNHSGYVYFYKIKAKDDKKWNLNYIGIQPSDTTIFTLDVNVSNNYNRLNELIDIDKQINDLLEVIAMKGRNRVSFNRNYGGYY